MERFEDLIDKLKPLSAYQIDSFYIERFAISVLKLLMKLGVKEKEVYHFDERKKRLRQLDKLRYIKDGMIGISYFPSVKDRDAIEVDGKNYKVFWYFKDTLYGNQVENCNLLQKIDMDTWGTIYNYLRIETNSRQKKTAES